mgnify:CR=1 FL=1
MNRILKYLTRFFPAKRLPPELCISRAGATAEDVIRAARWRHPKARAIVVKQRADRLWEVTAESE